jgi:hypothetical protein
VIARLRRRRGAPPPSTPAPANTGRSPLFLQAQGTAFSRGDDIEDDDDDDDDDGRHADDDDDDSLLDDYDDDDDGGGGGQPSTTATRRRPSPRTRAAKSIHAAAQRRCAAHTKWISLLDRLADSAGDAECAPLKSATSRQRAAAARLAVAFVAKHRPRYVLDVPAGKTDRVRERGERKKREERKRRKRRGRDVVRE